MFDTACFDQIVFDKEVIHYQTLTSTEITVLSLLKQMVEENPLGLFKGIIIGQVLEYLEKLKL